MIVLLVSDLMDAYLNSEPQFSELHDKDDKTKPSELDAPES